MKTSLSQTLDFLKVLEIAFSLADTNYYSYQYPNKSFLLFIIKGLLF